MPLSKFQRYAQYKRSPEMGMILEADRIQTELEKKLRAEIRETVLNDPKFMASILQNVMSEIHGIKRGEDGYTPEKGKDYFTPTELRELVQIIESRIKVPKDGEKGEPGKDGKDGKDGISPTLVPGVDFPTEEQVKNLISTEIAYLFSLKPKKDKSISKDEVNQLIGKIQQKIDWKANAEEIARALETLKGKDGLDYYALKNLPDLALRNRRHTLHRGGGAGGGSETMYYDLSALTDGVTKSFTIPANTRIIWVGGTDAPGGQYRQTTDYTGSGTTTLTLTDEVIAPSANSTLHLLFVV